jgi:hypothetical protein
MALRRASMSDVGPSGGIKLKIVGSITAIPE